MLKRELKITDDGSKTLFIPEWNESYHSKHGALREAEHVFIAHGLNHFKGSSTIDVLEYGFGTGLNALLSYLWSKDHNQPINYTSLEKFPIAPTEISAMDFHSILSQKYKELRADPIYEIFLKFHHCPWNQYHKITSNFSLNKQNQDFRSANIHQESIDIVFFDAFGRRVQPELWSVEIFEAIFKGLKPGGLLTTYACNGPTKRALEACGFKVEKLPGPPGKREMINAWKS